MNNYAFWDFVNDMDNRPSPNGRRGGRPEDWSRNFNFGQGFPFGPMPHRGRDVPPPPRDGPDGPEPPRRSNSPPPRPGTPGTPPEEYPRPPSRGDRAGSPPPPPPPPFEHPHHGPGHHGPGHHGPGPHGPGHHGRGHHGPDHHEPDHHASGHHGGRRRGGRGGRGGRHFGGSPPPGFGRHGRRGRHEGPSDHPYAYFLENIPHYAQQYANQIPEFLSSILPPPNGGDNTRGGFEQDQGLMMVDVDVFDTPDSYIIHVSMPGAKKSDIDVEYESGTQRVNVTGVIARPAEVDEALMAMQTQGERRTGFFERKIYLEGPHTVDAEAMEAKLEDGVLRIELPKEKDEEWTEVKKVPIT